MVHWADVTAQELMAKHGSGKQVFATAITPSGPIHVGNMREVLTTEAIFRATKEAGGDCELLYIADDYDPLRKVYPFLHAGYEEHVGKPLREIPCPCGDHAHYAEHFLEPFLANLAELGIEPTALSAYDLYHDGRYQDHIRTALAKADEIRGIIEKVSGRQLPKRWAPFNPQAPSGAIGGVEVLAVEGDHVTLKDPADGTEHTVDATGPGAGKLPWRIDWPARWDFLGVTFEAFGKDHGAKGGSWDTGVRLVRDVFDGQEPDHVMYEFLQLKGKGAMHSSTGLAVSAEEVLRMTPPEVLRYLLVRQSPRKHIDFDPGLGILNLVDEFDRMERIRYGLEEDTGAFSEIERTHDLSYPHGAPATPPNKVAYRHLTTVCQMAVDLSGVETILRRSGELTGELSDDDRALLSERVDHVRYWLDRFAPENLRFEVQETLPEYGFTDDDRVFLSALAEGLAAVDWNGQDIHDAVYKAKGERKPGEAFRALYQAILGQDRGPRAGFFLASQERDWVVERLRAAATA